MTTQTKIQDIDSLAFTAYERALIKRIFDTKFLFFPTIGLKDDLFVQYNRTKETLEDLKKKESSTINYRNILNTYTKLQDLRSKLVENNLGLIVKLAQSFSIYNLDQDELIGEGNLLLLDVIDKFNPCKGYKFSTYLYNSIRSKFSKILKETNKQNIVSLSWDHDIEKEDSTEKEELIKLILLILKNNFANLSKKELKIIKLRYLYNNKRPTLKEVGETFSPSVHKNYVQVLEKKGLAKIKNFLEKNT